MFLSIKGDFANFISEALQSYGVVFAIFTIGLVVGIAVKQFLIDINYKRAIKDRLKDKDQTISDLKQIVHERVVKIKADSDHSFYKKVVRYFKSTT